jgi:hypothetical protein
VITPEDPEITFGNTVNFNSSNSFDDDDDPMSFEWFVDGTSVSTDSGFNYDPPSDGFYTIKLEAADQCGNAATETTLTVNPRYLYR